MHPLAEDLHQRGTHGICSGRRSILEKLGFQPFDFRFQIAHAPLQVRQAIKRCREFDPKTAVHRGGSSNDGAWWQITRESSLAIDYASVADGEVARAGGLAGENAVATHLCGTG